MNKNPNCCGGHCREATGEVRVYPLGAGGNLILCRACWAHENNYRCERQYNYMQGSKYYSDDKKRAEANWPLADWHTAEVYGSQP